MRIISTYIDRKSHLKTYCDMMLMGSCRAKKKWLHLIRVIVSFGVRWIMMSMDKFAEDEMASAKT